MLPFYRRLTHRCYFSIYCIRSWQRSEKKYVFISTKFLCETKIVKLSHCAKERGLRNDLEMVIAFSHETGDAVNCIHRSLQKNHLPTYIIFPRTGCFHEFCLCCKSRKTRQIKFDDFFLLLEATCLIIG